MIVGRRALLLFLSAAAAATTVEAARSGNHLADHSAVANSNLRGRNSLPKISNHEEAEVENVLDEIEVDEEDLISEEEDTDDYDDKFDADNLLLQNYDENTNNFYGDYDIEEGVGELNSAVSFVEREEDEEESNIREKAFANTPKNNNDNPKISFLNGPVIEENNENTEEFILDDESDEDYFLRENDNSGHHQSDYISSKENNNSPPVVSKSVVNTNNKANNDDVGVNHEGKEVVNQYIRDHMKEKPLAENDEKMMTEPQDHPSIVNTDKKTSDEVHEEEKTQINHFIHEQFEKVAKKEESIANNNNNNAHYHHQKNSNDVIMEEHQHENADVREDAALSRQKINEEADIRMKTVKAEAKEKMNTVKEEAKIKMEAIKEMANAKKEAVLDEMMNEKLSMIDRQNEKSNNAAAVISNNNEPKRHSPRSAGGGGGDAVVKSVHEKTSDEVQEDEKAQINHFIHEQFEKAAKNDDNNEPKRHSPRSAGGGGDAVVKSVHEKTSDEVHEEEKTQINHFIHEQYEKVAKKKESNANNNISNSVHQHHQKNSNNVIMEEHQHENADARKDAAISRQKINEEAAIRMKAIKAEAKEKMNALKEEARIKTEAIEEMANVKKEEVLDEEHITKNDEENLKFYEADNNDYGEDSYYNNESSEDNSNESSMNYYKEDYVDDEEEGMVPMEEETDPDSDMMTMSDKDKPLDFVDDLDNEIEEEDEESKERMFDMLDQELINGEMASPRSDSGIEDQIHKKANAGTHLETYQENNEDHIYEEIAKEEDKEAEERMFDMLDQELINGEMASPRSDSGMEDHIHKKAKAGTHLQTYQENYEDKEPSDNKKEHALGDKARADIHNYIHQKTKEYGTKQIKEVNTNVEEDAAISRQKIIEEAHIKAKTIKAETKEKMNALKEEAKIKMEAIEKMANAKKEAVLDEEKILDEELSTKNDEEEEKPLNFVDDLDKEIEEEDEEEVEMKMSDMKMNAIDAEDDRKFMNHDNDFTAKQNFGLYLHNLEKELQDDIRMRSAGQDELQDLFEQGLNWMKENPNANREDYMREQNKLENARTTVAEGDKMRMAPKIDHQHLNHYNEDEQNKNPYMGAAHELEDDTTLYKDINEEAEIKMKAVHAKEEVMKNALKEEAKLKMEAIEKMKNIKMEELKNELKEDNSKFAEMRSDEGMSSSRMHNNDYSSSTEPNEEDIGVRGGKNNFDLLDDIDKEITKEEDKEAEERMFDMLDQELINEEMSSPRSDSGMEDHIHKKAKAGTHLQTYQEDEEPSDNKKEHALGDKARADIHNYIHQKTKEYGTKQIKEANTNTGDVEDEDVKTRNKEPLDFVDDLDKAIAEEDFEEEYEDSEKTEVEFLDTGLNSETEAHPLQNAFSGKLVKEGDERVSDNNNHYHDEVTSDLEKHMDLLDDEKDAAMNLETNGSEEEDESLFDTDEEEFRLISSDISPKEDQKISDSRNTNSVDVESRSAGGNGGGDGGKKNSLIFSIFAVTTIAFSVLLFGTLFVQRSYEKQQLLEHQEHFVTDYDLPTGVLRDDARGVV